MLSKYEHLKKGSAAVRNFMQEQKLAAVLCECLEQKYRDRVILGEALQGGTLGIFFQLMIGGKKKFVKTHLEGNGYRENIIKEIEIMSLLYKDVIEIEKENVLADGKQFVFMIMDKLFPCSCPPAPKEVKEWQCLWQNRLRGADLKVQYSFAQILEAGKESLEALYAQEFLTKDLYFRCIESLHRIQDKWLVEPQTICHGDLSNVNILQDKNGRRIVIDWEDALIAFPEYDYLYWLTFFSQRKYYGTKLFKSECIERIWGTDLMILITIIKSEMSYQSGSYVNNNMSFQDRICEIYEIADV